MKTFSMILPLLCLCLSAFGESVAELRKSREATDKDGKVHGTAIYYNGDGSKFKEIVYENGRHISSKRF
jgi:hypothetical protein